MKDNHIDKLFNHKLEHHEMEAPEDSWDAIERSLAAKRKPMLFPMWARVAAVGVILLLIGSIGYQHFKDNKPQQTAIIIQKTELPVFSSGKAGVSNNVQTAQSLPDLQKKNRYKNLIKPVQHRSGSTSPLWVSKSDKEKSISSGEVSFDSVKVDDLNSIESITDNPITESRTATKSEMEEFLNTGLEQESINNHRVKHKRSSVGLLAAFIGPSENTTKEEYSSFRSASKTDKVYAMLNAVEFNAENNATSVRHSLPITLGLSVEKEIGNKISLQTGLYGSYLRSTQSLSTSLYFTDEIQELYYLGLPLSIAYRFAESERFAFYMKTGGMVEKNIGGRWRERIRKNSEVIYSKLERDLENKLQWSAHVGGGVNYNLSGWTNLFLEPSLSYYFDNNSNIENIHKQKKLDINLQAGVRAIFESH